MLPRFSRLVPHTKSFNPVFSSVFKRDLKNSDSKELHTLSSGKRNHGKSELVLANNAGLFGTHWSLNNHASNEHDELSIIRLPFWLDKTLSEYDPLSWGQTIPGFPKIIRVALKKLFPSYPEDKKVTWGMLKETRNFIIEDLKKKPFLRFIDFSDYDLKDLNNNKFSIQHSGDKFLFKYESSTLARFSSTAHVYNSVRISKKIRIRFITF